MSLDREVCLCFHVTRRKLQNFIRIEEPKHPSQLSECFGAGTGCGWCRPFLKKMFDQAQAAPAKPPIDSGPTSGGSSEMLTDNLPLDFLDESPDFDNFTAEDYADHRSKYIKQGKGKPP